VLDDRTQIAVTILEKLLEGRAPPYGNVVTDAVQLTDNLLEELRPRELCIVGEGVGREALRSVAQAESLLRKMEAEVLPAPEEEERAPLPLAPATEAVDPDEARLEAAEEEIGTGFDAVPLTAEAVVDQIIYGTGFDAEGKPFQPVHWQPPDEPAPPPVAVHEDGALTCGPPPDGRSVDEHLRELIESAPPAVQPSQELFARKIAAKLPPSSQVFTCEGRFEEDGHCPGGTTFDPVTKGRFCPLHLAVDASIRKDFHKRNGHRNRPPPKEAV
jgi:hypothetical protein